MRFDSKRDLWLVLLLRGIPLVVLAAVIYAGWKSGHRDVRGPVAGAVIVLVAELFFESLLRTTYYEIADGTLLIRSSFMKWRVPIAQIHSVRPTRNPLSSPALSLDRLDIEYGGKHILVSPEDKRGFIAALRSVNPAIST